MSYEAKITKLVNVRPHPNADRLQLATVSGYQIVVGLENYEGQLGVFFPCDGQLSQEYAEANDLIERKDPVTGERAGGYFSSNRRVRSQRLRKEKSDGFWATLDTLAFTKADVASLTEGMVFDTLNGVPICNKYYTPATLRQMKATGPRRQLVMFPKHIETKKFQYEADEWLVPGSIVYLTEKLHGTSQRQSCSLETTPKKRRWYHKLTRSSPGETQQWSFVVGTRNVVLRDPTQGFYEDESFRRRVIESFLENIHKGEVIFGEVVGYVDSETPVMGTQDTSKLKDIKAAYGPNMTYSYGCIPGECKFFVYRIIQVNEDGVITEKPWSQVKARCDELGISYVPELAGPLLISSDEDVEAVKFLVDQYENGPSTLDQGHIREGVAIRVERSDGVVGFLKSKSFDFGVLEGYLKNSDEYVDLEEVG